MIERNNLPLDDALMLNSWRYIEYFRRTKRFASDEWFEEMDSIRRIRKHSDLLLFSLELAIKCFLIRKGKNEKQIIKFGHNLKKLFKEMEAFAVEFSFYKKWYKSNFEKSSIDPNISEEEIYKSFKEISGDIFELYCKKKGLNYYRFSCSIKSSVIANIYTLYINYTDYLIGELTPENKIYTI